ncbi:MAG: TrkH family potassium uptake protein [Lachnospirales bacterium]
MNIIKIYKNATPTQIIITGFLTIIFLGTILLMLPVSSKAGTPTDFLTALFTSTSAVCVTGLVVVNTLAHWSFFGKVVILILIQIGGLGFMAIITMFYLVFRKKVSLKSRLVIQESLNQPTFHGMVKLVTKAIKGTFIFEGIAAIIFTIVFYIDLDVSFGTSLFMGIFHAVSAFCNAGFDILGDSSLTPYYNHLLVNLVLMFLIISGGAGFALWLDVNRVRKFKFKNKKATLKEKYQKLTLHSKIAINASIVLILVGWVAFFIIEYTNDLTIGNLSFGSKILTSLFHSVSLRTAGFNTISMGGLTDASKLVSIFFMIIGGSPGGTAGGLKTVTLAIVILTVVSVIRGQSRTIVFNRTIPSSLVRKALSVTTIYIIVFFLATFLLLVIEKESGFSFIDISFEVASAIGTVGLSTGLTSSLSTLSRIIIIICMFLGRLGPISVGVALTAKMTETNNSLEYLEENVLVG